MRKSTRFLSYLCVAFCLSAVLYTSQSALAADESRSVRVGVYQNEPKIYRDALGIVTGFWADIVNYIAEKEDWDVVYVFGTWEEGLQREMSAG